MKITNDRLAVAWAVQEHIEFLMGESFDLYPEEVIAAIPEPPDDSPATLPSMPCQPCDLGNDWAECTCTDPRIVDEQPEPLPAPTGPGWWWARYSSFDRPNGEWMVVEVFAIGEGLRVVDDDIDDFDAWVGPLVAPTAKGGA